MKTLKKKLNKKGFTLAELLIVVAIIAVLAAIAFPLFTSQLHKAKAGTDLANLRSAISVVNYELLTDKAADTKSVQDAVDAALPNVDSQLVPGTGIVVTVTGTGDAKTATITIGGNDLDYLIGEAS